MQKYDMNKFHVTEEECFAFRDCRGETGSFPGKDKTKFSLTDAEIDAMIAEKADGEKVPAAYGYKTPCTLTEILNALCVDVYDRETCDKLNFYRTLHMYNDDDDLRGSKTGTLPYEKEARGIVDRIIDRSYESGETPEDGAKFVKKLLSEKVYGGGTLAEKSRFAKIRTFFRTCSSETGHRRARREAAADPARTFRKAACADLKRAFETASGGPLSPAVLQGIADCVNLLPAGDAKTVEAAKALGMAMLARPARLERSLGVFPDRAASR